ncbi:hypothetical protein CYFUS_000266 [Cystobacter fuscus]|uniref:Uncharacterized protein n=1 Tax=Cystobacter fuscus TaxID=43 RepID=A0A250ISY7_9BACT|nr:hypothetical protein [Cystobacter fuscus]ATB34859.1 hypothetical protein CYFUS_000266 [Cystobacter fuscus]
MGSEVLTSPRFFVLEGGATHSHHDVELDAVEPVNLGAGVDCPRCGGPIGMRQWLPPYRANLVLHGEAFGDFIGASGDDILISERLAQAFRDEGLTGLEGFHPVEILRVRKRGREPRPSASPHYVLVRACFGRAAVDLAHSQLRGAQPPACEECRYTHFESIHGFTLEPGTWKGEDIFRPRGLHGVLTVSERFERFVAQHEFTHLRLTPSEKYVWDPHALQSRPGAR